MAGGLCQVPVHNVGCHFLPVLIRKLEALTLHSQIFVLLA